MIYAVMNFRIGTGATRLIVDFAERHFRKKIVVICRKELKNQWRQYSKNIECLLLSEVNEYDFKDKLIIVCDSAIPATNRLFNPYNVREKLETISNPVIWKGHLTDDSCVRNKIFRKF